MLHGSHNHTREYCGSNYTVETMQMLLKTELMEDRYYTPKVAEEMHTLHEKILQ